jgi:hypothetical protein
MAGSPGYQPQIMQLISEDLPMLIRRSIIRRVVWTYVNGITKGLSDELFVTGIKMTGSSL